MADNERSVRVHLTPPPCLLFPSWLPLLFPSTLLSMVRPNLESSRIARRSIRPYSVLLLTFPTFYSYSSLSSTIHSSNFVYVCTTYASGTMFSHRDRSSTVSTNFFSSLSFSPKRRGKGRRLLLGKKSHLVPFLTENSYRILRGTNEFFFHNAVEIKFHGFARHNLPDKGKLIKITLYHRILTDAGYATVKI